MPFLFGVEVCFQTAVGDQEYNFDWEYHKRSISNQWVSYKVNIPQVQFWRLARKYCLDILSNSSVKDYYAKMEGHKYSCYKNLPQF